MNDLASTEDHGPSATTPAPIVITPVDDVYQQHLAFKKKAKRWLRIIGSASFFSLFISILTYLQSGAQYATVNLNTDMERRLALLALLTEVDIDHDGNVVARHSVETREVAFRQLLPLERHYAENNYWIQLEDLRLEGCHLHGLNLSHLSFYRCNFDGARLRDNEMLFTSIAVSDFTVSVIENVSLYSATIAWSKIHSSIFKASLDGSLLWGNTWEGSRIIDSNYTRSQDVMVTLDVPAYFYDVYLKFPSLYLQMSSEAGGMEDCLPVFSGIACRNHGEALWVSALGKTGRPPTRPAYQNHPLIGLESALSY